MTANSRYLKNPDETDYEYGLRLIGILIEENPEDLEWEDLIELLKLDIHRDTLRKASQTQFGGYAVMQYFKEKMINNASTQESLEFLLEEIEEKTLELEKQRIMFQTTKTEYRKWRRQDVRLEMFFDEIKDSIVKVEVPDFEPIEVNPNYDRIGLLGISDFHFGKIFYSINNAYSEEIFYGRMNKLIFETVELCREQHISHLHVLNTGDDIEGMTLRISQLASLQDGMTDQTIKVARYMVKFLKKLSVYIPITYHHVLCGNHSEVRAFGDKSFTFENMERVILAYIHDNLEENSRVEVIESNGKYLDFKIFDYNIFAQHGQKVKNPNKIIASASMLHRKFYDIAYFGHLHHGIAMTTNEAETHDVEVVYVPSIMGSDEFSDDNYFGGAKASAIFDIYENGICRKGSFKILLN